MSLFGDIEERHSRVTDANITGYLIVFAFFTTGLVTAMIIGTKIVSFGPLTVPASVFLWALTYPCSDIVAEVYGIKYARKMVLGGFIAFCSMFCFLWLAIIMPPAPFWEGQENFAKMFGSSFRVMLGTMVSYLITQFADVYIFGLLRKKTAGKFLWLRNNLSTMISQTLANTIFLSIAFIGVFEWQDWWNLYTGNLITRYSIAWVDTVVVYAAVYSLYKFYPSLKKPNQT